jgi:hypothetical protein
VPPHKIQFTFHPDSLFKLLYALYGPPSYSLHLFQIAGRSPEHPSGGMKAAYEIAIAYAAQAFNKTQGQPMICILLHRCRYLLSKSFLTAPIKPGQHFICLLGASARIVPAIYIKMPSPCQALLSRAFMPAVKKTLDSHSAFALNAG